MLRFTATECGSKIDHGTMICGASNSQANGEAWHSFILMRGHRSLEDDDGPYFELDDQSQGFYNGVEGIRFEGRLVTFRLAPPRGESIGHRVIEVKLDCPRAQVAAFRRGLKTIFRDQSWRLEGV